jgi:hypothetical protein
MMDVDERIRDYAERWRAAQPVPSPLDPTALAEPRGNQFWRPLPIRRLAVLAALTLIVMTAAVLIVVRTGEHSTRVAAGTAAVPVAAPPLLTHRLGATGKIVLATGDSGATRWAFYVQVNPSNSPNEGLCMGFQTPSGMSSSCGDPSVTPSLALFSNSPGGDPNVILLYGVTSARAAHFLVSIPGQQTRSAAALQNQALPELRFFVTAVQPAERVQVDALSANGQPLVRNDPNATGPLLAPPPPLPSTRPDSHPIWPLDNQPGLESAVAAARDFSTRALHTTGNTITPDQSVHANSPTEVTIDLPAVHRNLRVLASPRPDGTWVLLQVGDQARMRGITYRPGGQPTGPVMSILAPDGAVDADVTERVGDGLHHIHLSHSDLQSGVVHLAGDSGTIFDVLIVYHDQGGTAIDALGEQF